MMDWSILTLLLTMMMPAVQAQREAGPMNEAPPAHLLFWQESDVRDARSVHFTAHPFPEDRIEVLIEAEADSSTLWYMPTDVVPVGGGIRVYYQRVEKGRSEYVHQRVWCLGVLGEDGFSLPDLGLFEQPWLGPGNVVMQRSPHTPTWGGFNVFQIARNDDGGFTALYWDQPAAGPAGGMLATSSDGIHWTKDERGAVFTEHNDAYSLIRNPYGGGFLLYQTQLKDWPDKPHPDNLAGRRRVISLRRSADLVNWSPQEIILEPDDEDGPAAEFYLLSTTWYVDRQVGLLMKYYANPERPNRHSDIVPNEIIFSRDGVTWERPHRDTQPGVWSYADLFEYDGSLCAVAHKDRNLVLARTRLDGLASVGAEANGSFRTHAFPMPEGDLSLNADCRGGAIGVQVIADTGDVLAACRLADVDGTALPLTWGRDLPEDLVARMVHLRFTLDNARVYSLREVE